MIRLIALGVILLILMAAIGTVISRHDAKVKAGVVAVWKPLFDQQKEATDTAVGAANQNLETIHLYRDQAQECSRATKGLEQAAKDARAERDAILSKNAGRIAQLEADRRKHQQQTTTPDPAGATCEQKLGNINGILDDLGARRMRDHPAAVIGPPAPRDGLTISK